MHCLKVRLCSILLIALNLVQALPAPQSKEQIRIDDMLLTAEQFEYLNGTDMPKSAISWPQFYWPERTVVYSISQQFSPNKVQVILNAMSEIESVSCIRFRPTANISEHHVAIHRNKTGCFADLGYQGKVQEMNLGIGCIHKGTIQHELLHSLGFVHMHCDPRRDDYVTIYWDNIEEKEKKQFVKIDPRLVTDFGVEYDYSSIMHYGAFTFSRNHQETIVPKLYGAKIGLQELSRLDKVKLNAAYCRSESPN